MKAMFISKKAQAFMWRHAPLFYFGVVCLVAAFGSAAILLFQRAF